jgi:hypothetical protein
MKSLEISVFTVCIASIVFNIWTICSIWIRGERARGSAYKILTVILISDIMYNFTIFLSIFLYASLKLKNPLNSWLCDLDGSLKIFFSNSLFFWSGCLMYSLYASMIIKIPIQREPLKLFA